MKTIIVIEDQTVLATAYGNKFRSEGFKVEVAQDGVEGCLLIERAKPDLVLLDMMLPKMSGLDVLKRVRSQPAFKSLPIVVLSNLAQPNALEDAWQAGATQVLSKFNTSPRKVLEAVQALLSTDRIQVEPSVAEIGHKVKSSPGVTGLNAGQSAGHILLCEANADLNSLLTFLLCQSGHQVTAVTRNADALAQSQAQKFDLLLLGREAPQSNVASLSAALHRAHPGLPIILYSTAALFSEQQEGLKAGATAYLVKPEDLFNIGRIASDLLSTEPVRSQIRAA